MSYSIHNVAGVFGSYISLWQNIVKFVSLSESDTPVV